MKKKGRNGKGSGDTVKNNRQEKPPETSIEKAAARQLGLLFFGALILTTTNVAAQNIKKNAVCLVQPFDGKPENRVNVLVTKGIAAIMHVKSDYKTLLSKPKVLQIELSKQIKNMTTHRLEDESVFAIDFKSGQAIYYKPPIEKGGVIYRCQEVQLVQD